MKEENKEQLIWEKGKPIPGPNSNIRLLRNEQDLSFRQLISRHDSNIRLLRGEQDLSFRQLISRHDSNTWLLRNEQDLSFSQLISRHDSDIWRLDAYGNIIRRDLYGQRVQHGWKIDYIVPLSDGGNDDISNLQPIQWEKNRELGDKKMRRRDFTENERREIYHRDGGFVNCG